MAQRMPTRHVFATRTIVICAFHNQSPRAFSGTGITKEEDVGEEEDEEHKHEEEAEEDENEDHHSQKKIAKA